MDFNFYDLYLRAGLSDPIAKSLDSITSSFIVLVIAFIVTLIFKKVLLVFFNQIAKRTKSNFDDYLIKNKVYIEQYRKTRNRKIKLFLNSLLAIHTWD